MKLNLSLQTFVCDGKLSYLLLFLITLYYKDMGFLRASNRKYDS